MQILASLATRSGKGWGMNPHERVLAVVSRAALDLTQCNARMVVLKPRSALTSDVIDPSLPDRSGTFREAERHVPSLINASHTMFKWHARAFFLFAYVTPLVSARRRPHALLNTVKCTLSRIQRTALCCPDGPQRARSAMQLLGSNAAQFHTRQRAASALPASCNDFLATQGTLLREEAQCQMIVAVTRQSQPMTLKAF